MHSYDEVSKALEVFGEFDGSKVDLKLGFGKESDFETRCVLLADLLDGLQGESPLDVAASLQDIRVRDGFLRSVHDLHNLESFEEVERILDGLLFVASNSLGDVRHSAMACFGGISWIAGDNGEALRAVLNSNWDNKYSLLQLLDIAIRHDVPSSVWSASLMAVSLESCLTGAA
jgi:hypothetical protein